MISIDECIFNNSNNSFELYIKPEDNILITNSIFDDSSINMFSGIFSNLVTTNLEQLLISYCNFKNYYNRGAFYFNTNNELWLPNIIFIYNSVKVKLVNIPAPEYAAPKNIQTYHDMN